AARRPPSDLLLLPSASVVHTQEFSRYARRSHAITSESTSPVDARGIRRRIVSWAFRRRRPTGFWPSRRSPRSTRLLVVAWTRANVRRGDTRETPVFLA